MIYNFLLLLFFFIMAPKMLFLAGWKKKRMPALRDRFGVDPPQMKTPNGRRIWIHAVSLGEIKASQPLIHQILQRDPLIEILITSLTATGFEEAVRLFSSVCTIRYLPLDFSWIMRRWLNSFRPDWIVFIEGDVWPNLISEAKRLHISTALVSGKISQKSAKRFRVFRSVARHLFGSLDFLCVQNEEYRDRFASLVDRPIHIAGNLKLDILPIQLQTHAVRNRFLLSSDQPVITIACTHAPEEYDLLRAIQPLWKSTPNLVVFLAPRHPERFHEVASILTQMKIPFCHWNDPRSQEGVVLVDAMGQLPLCYSVSHLAIVAGSFSSNKGGHNVIEPCLYGCPVLFGPSMHTQSEFAKILLQSGAGKEVSEDMLADVVVEWFETSAQLRSNALRLIEQNRGSAARTIDLIFSKNDWG